MTEEARCDCHDFLVDMCPGKQRRPQASGIVPIGNIDDPTQQGFFKQLTARAETNKGPWFTASFPGECSGCGMEYDTGDDLRADGEGGWEARCCDDMVS